MLLGIIHDIFTSVEMCRMIDKTNEWMVIRVDYA